MIDDLVSLLPLQAAEVARLGRGESLDLALEIALLTVKVTSQVPALVKPSVLVVTVLEPGAMVQ